MDNAFYVKSKLHATGKVMVIVHGMDPASVFAWTVVMPFSSSIMSGMAPFPRLPFRGIQNDICRNGP